MSGCMHLRKLRRADLRVCSGISGELFASNRNHQTARRLHAGQANLAALRPAWAEALAFVPATEKNEAPPYRNYGSIFSRAPTGRRPERHAARLRLSFTGETPRGDFSVDFLSEKDNPCYGVFSVLKYGPTPFGIWRTRIWKMATAEPDRGGRG